GLLVHRDGAAALERAPPPRRVGMSCAARPGSSLRALRHLSVGGRGSGIVRWLRPGRYRHALTAPTLQAGDEPAGMVLELADEDRPLRVRSRHAIDLVRRPPGAH